MTRATRKPKAKKPGPKKPGPKKPRVESSLACAVVELDDGWVKALPDAARLARRAARAAYVGARRSGRRSLTVALAGDAAVRKLNARDRNKDKPPADHFTHLVVHGTLHLLGYDHETGELAAERMEALERRVLAKLGVADPYIERS